MTDTHGTPTPHEMPRPAVDEVRRLLASGIRAPSRLGFTALLLAGASMAAITASLLLTEPGLPSRTRIAFAVMTGVGVSWAALAAWVLLRRRVLLAGHRVLAGYMAVTYTMLFTLGMLALGRWGPAGRAWLYAAAVGVVLVAAALVVLVRARRRWHALDRRRRELERQLGSAGATS